MASYYFQEDMSAEESAGEASDTMEVDEASEDQKRHTSTQPSQSPSPPEAPQATGNANNSMPTALRTRKSESPTSQLAGIVEESEGYPTTTTTPEPMSEASKDESEKEEEPKPHMDDARSMAILNIRVLEASANKHLPWTESPSHESTPALRFVPQTRVFYINKKYRTVFLLDVSSSILTVDAGGTRIVMSQVMETLAKCLTGLSEKFSCPGIDDTFVDTEIHVTVIAECSHFASNAHTGEMLANFPTMKVLLQDIVLTRDNLSMVLGVLKEELAKFQSKLSQFRGKLRRKREELGYVLAVEDAIDPDNAEMDGEDDISGRKSWGVGLSGANLSYTLNTGLFALDLMPDSASPSMVIITDGVVKSNLLQGSWILRRLMELDVSCSIIQLGGKDGINPSCNWGFIQDTEALKYVTDSTLGKFMYSQECPIIERQKLGSDTPAQRVAPNMYHRTFLIRELCLLKPKPGLDELDEKEDYVAYSMANFPWDPKSQPEPIKMMETTCKEYLLNIPVDRLIGVRIRQGFRIKGVFFGTDPERQSYGRYLITMTLNWLPHVTVQYKLKGQASGDWRGKDFLSRLESPKVEIDIIAYQAFAIHFLNSQHAPINSNHSVYAKVYRLHRYLVGLSDSDVALRGMTASHAVASQTIISQKSKQRDRSRHGSRGLTHEEQEKEDQRKYLVRMSEQWEAYARDGDHQYSRCWYNEHDFCVLLLVDPPAFLPSSQDSDHSLVKHAEAMDASVEQIRKHLETTWATFVSRGVFVKTFHSYGSELSNAQFCELRLFRDTHDALIRFQIRFFGLDHAERCRLVQELHDSLAIFEAAVDENGLVKLQKSDQVSAKIWKCQRPLHLFLMRHLIYEAPLSHTPELALTGFHTHVSEPIGEESIMRSYLAHRHWGWKDQNMDPIYLAENAMVASQDIAFQYLCAQRLGEGFILASIHLNRAVFYKEMRFTSKSGTRTSTETLCAVQYLIFRSQVSGEIVTELWMEPCIDLKRRRAFHRLKSRVLEVDRLILSSLSTFEAIHAIGRMRIRPSVQPVEDQRFIYPWLFDPPTLLRQHRFIALAFPAPLKLSLASPREESEVVFSKKCLHTLGMATTIGTFSETSGLVAPPTGARELYSLLRANNNTSTTSLNNSMLEAELARVARVSENSIASQYKDQLRELCCADRDLAILHLFMEHSLSQLADGEIMAGGDDASCDQYFKDVTTSIVSNPQVRQILRDFHGVETFHDIRCFVKIPNPRVFLLIILPKLSAFVSHMLLKRLTSPEEAEHSRNPSRQDYLSCMVFECMRSKPLSDITDYNPNVAEFFPSVFEFQPALRNQRGTPSTSNVPLLIHPVLFETQSERNKARAKLWESTANLNETISIAYSHSYTKAIYASLIERHPVNKYDLEQAYQICTKTTVDINITGFLNTIEQQRRDGTLRVDQSVLKARFREVLGHYFELAPVDGTHIYYYRPIIRKVAPKTFIAKGRKRSPSVSRSGSLDAEAEDALEEMIECAERPLFLRLECSFQKPLALQADLEKSNLKSSVTFPVDDLPTSYIYKEDGSPDSDYSPSNIGFSSRPVDSTDGTVATLHLVFMTLPTPEEYSGSSLKSTADAGDTKVGPEGTLSVRQQFASLDSMQQEAIAATESRLEWMLKEEIMHGLLNVAPVTPDILAFVEAQLKTNSAFVKFPTSLTVPLVFVKTSRGRDIFAQELRRVDADPYELHQIQEYFYLTEKASTNGSLSDTLTDNSTSLDESEGREHEQDQLKSATATKDSCNSGRFESAETSNDLAQGLGIVLLSPSEQARLAQSSGSQSSSAADTSSKSAFARAKNQPRNFWMILIPRANYVQLYFFSKILSEEQCTKLIEDARQVVSNLCVRVNQLTLLQSLNETRRCSNYLVPSEGTDPSMDSGSESDQDDSTSQDEESISGGVSGSRPLEITRKFQPGEFACPVVYSVSWPLHWRVKPGQALKSVAGLVLNPFIVYNRKNFFVIESQDDYDETKKIVVFLRLNEVEVQDTVGITPDMDETLHPSTQTQTSHVHPHPHRPSSHLSVGKSGIEHGASSITLGALGATNSPASAVPDDVAGSHSNSPRPSPTASPGARVMPPAATPAIAARVNDTRRLVIEVYGVEKPGKSVTVDLFNLLENRFYNSVDIDFILPVDRLKPVRQILSIPRFINAPFGFLLYLKQNLCLYLNPLNGPDKVNVLRRHYQNYFGNVPLADDHHHGYGHSHTVQVGEFTFFYNAVQGRNMSAVESQVGIGLAGVCLTVLDANKKPTFEIGFQEGDQDIEEIREYFQSFPNNAGTGSSYSLLIEVWAQGNVNPQALLDIICLSFRQSLCDEVVETSIEQTLCVSPRDRRRNDDSTDDEQQLISERVQKYFIDPSSRVLRQAFEWKNPAVQSQTFDFSMPPWIMDSFLLELDEILTDVSMQFSPLIMRWIPERNRYKEYKASSASKKSFEDMSDTRFVLIGGIQDLGGGANSASYPVRRTSMGSERSHSRRSSLADGASVHYSHKTSTHSSQQHSRRGLDDIKMFPNAVSSNGHEETMLPRNCFVAILVNGFGLQVFTYNWGKQYYEFAFNAIERVVRWHKDRMRFLDNVLLQKLGLFHHAPSILAPPVSPAPPTQQPTPSLVSSHGTAPPSGMLQPSMPRPGVQNSPHLGNSSRIDNSPASKAVTAVVASAAATIGSSPSASSPRATNAGVVSDAGSLTTLIEEQFPHRPRSVGATGSSIYGGDSSDHAKASASVMSLVSRSSQQPQSFSAYAQVHSPLAQSPSQAAASPTTEASTLVANQIAAGLDVDQILRDSCLEPLETPREEDQAQDEVYRHCKPFLETFIQHCKSAEEQQNAYNVYQKWSKRYKDRKGSPNALHENMNIADLAIMLRSSRLLHFCRTPLLFTEFSSSLFPLADSTAYGPSTPEVGSTSAGGASGSGTGQDDARPGVASKTAAAAQASTVAWYTALAETFMKEYSQYLASVGMQLLMYGNSKFDTPTEATTSESGELSFMSKFTVSQTLSVTSPAAFLFKSLQGGSIMCEVRLQGMFVCVTLYTLNRRYGRVKVAAPGFATAEANKQSLRAFTEQCARFKDRIHVNSFVYDFHLRYIHKILMESSKMGSPKDIGNDDGFSNNSSSSNGESSPSPATKPSIGSMPYSFDLMDVLHQFLQYHSRPAAYARNRVYRGVYRTHAGAEGKTLPNNLFDYVIKNPQRYGFHTIHYMNRPRSCFVAGKDLLVGFGPGGGYSPDFQQQQGATSGDRIGQVSTMGFGVGPGLGGLATHVQEASDNRAHGSHNTRTRHTSHESGVPVSNKRMSRRLLSSSRSSYNVKEAGSIADDGVEYVLIVSHGEQDSLGLTVHYYLVILREEEVVKKLEESHGPLVGARDRALAANQQQFVAAAREMGSLAENASTSPFSGSMLYEQQHQLLAAAAVVDDGVVGGKQTNGSPEQAHGDDGEHGTAQSNHGDQATDQDQSAHQPGTEAAGDEQTWPKERLLDQEALQEPITEHVVLADVVRATEVRLDMMLRQAAQFYDRDSLWEMLLQGKIGQGASTLMGSGGALTAAASAMTSTTATPARGLEDSVVNSPATALVAAAAAFDRGGGHSRQSTFNQNSPAVAALTQKSNIAGGVGEQLGFADFLALGERFHSTPLEEMEPQFAMMLRAPGIDWNAVLTFLSRCYATWAREFVEVHNPSGGEDTIMDTTTSFAKAGKRHRPWSGRRSNGSPFSATPQSRRHLVIFNPHNRDLLVHFVVRLHDTSDDVNQQQQQHHHHHGRPWLSGYHTPGSSSIATDQRSLLSRGYGSHTSLGQLTQHSISSSHFARSGGVPAPAAHATTPRGANVPAHMQGAAAPSLATSTSSPMHTPTQPSSTTNTTTTTTPVSRPVPLAESSRMSSMSSIARVASMAMARVTQGLTGRKAAPATPGSEESAAFAHQHAPVTSLPSGSNSRRGSSSVSLMEEGDEYLGSELNTGADTTLASAVGEDGKSIASRQAKVLEERKTPEATTKEPRSRQQTMSTEASNDASDIVDDYEVIGGGEEVGKRHDDTLHESREDESGSPEGEEFNREEDNDDVEEGDECDEEEEPEIQVFSVSREPKTGFNSIEADHVGDIVRALSYWFWKTLP
ncbi:KICSTOR complex protein szt2 [Actinomortierella wolfii]|nr:KICSTOR complex protein szt2 [Actinomortierella wolfii]